MQNRFLIILPNTKPELINTARLAPVTRPNSATDTTISHVFGHATFYGNNNATRNREKNSFASAGVSSGAVEVLNAKNKRKG